MEKFFYLEGAYLILGGVILLITLFVTTRPFMAKGAVKKGMLGVSAALAVMIGMHHSITVDRMEEVKQAFENGETIICESRMERKVAPSIIIKKAQGWRIEGDDFVSPEYTRPFFTARCIVE